jgi:D-alanyl-D-alanine carboxypeptidase
VRTTLAACLVALASLLLSSPAATKMSGAPSSGLQRQLEAIVESKGGPPGIATLITRGGHKEFLAAGTAGGGLLPAPGLHFRIASVAKAFNSYAAIKLAGSGLSLSTTLGQSIPGVLPAAEAVTLRELLQHTSGIAEYIQAPAFGELLNANPTRYFSPTELTGFVRDEALEFTPESRYHYSDTDNIAAGLMEEEASGVPYEKLLGQRIFKPLGMRESSLPRTQKMPRPFLHGYDVEPGKKPEDVSELLSASGAWASGGIVSTPLDLSRFLPSYVPTVLGAARKAKVAFRPGASSPPGPGKNSASIGVFRYQTGCGTVYGHTGSFPGYRVFIAATANGKRSVVFVASAQIIPGGQGSQPVAKAITRAQAQAVCRALG